MVPEVVPEVGCPGGALGTVPDSTSFLISIETLFGHLSSGTTPGTAQGTAEDHRWHHFDASPSGCFAVSLSYSVCLFLCLWQPGIKESLRISKNKSINLKKKLSSRVQGKSGGET